MKLRYSGSAVGVWWVAPFGVERVRVRWVAPIAIEHWVASTECVDPLGGWHQISPLAVLQQHLIVPPTQHGAVDAWHQLSTSGWMAPISYFPCTYFPYFPDLFSRWRSAVYKGATQVTCSNLWMAPFESVPSSKEVSVGQGRRA